MSYITDVVLYAPGEEQAVDRLNAFYVSEDDPQTLKPLDVDAAGGNKGMHPRSVWAAGFNYLNEERFLLCFAAAPWVFPESVVVVLCTEGDRSRTFTPKIASALELEEPYP